MRICCCGSSPSSNDANVNEPLLSGGAADIPNSKVMDDRKAVTDLSVESSMHSGRSSVLDPLDDSNLHEALHWDKIVQRTDDATEPTLLSGAST